MGAVTWSAWVWFSRGGFWFCCWPVSPAGPSSPTLNPSCMLSNRAQRSVWMNKWRNRNIMLLALVFISCGDVSLLYSKLGSWWFLYCLPICYISTIYSLMIQFCMFFTCSLFVFLHEVSPSCMWSSACLLCRWAWCTLFSFTTPFIKALRHLMMGDIDTIFCGYLYWKKSYYTVWRNSNEKPFLNEITK